MEALYTISPDELKAFISDAVKEAVAAIQPAKPEPANTWLNVQELLDYLPHHPARQTLYGWVSSGIIPFHKKGKKLYFRKNEIDEWLAAGRKETHVETKANVNDFLAKRVKKHK